jgi:hypothetical protein
MVSAATATSTYASVAAVATPLRPAALALTPPTSGVAAPARAAPAAFGSGTTASAPVQLSPLGRAAGAVSSLNEAAAPGPSAASERSRRIAEALAVLNQSIGSLGETGSDDDRALAFLSNARLSQRLLASGLTDTVNGRASTASLAAIGLTPLANGSFGIDRAQLEQALRDNPAGVRELITDYARNLDAFFAQRAGIALDLPGLRGLTGLDGRTPTDRSGPPGLSALGDFNTRRALAAFRNTSLL